MLSTAKSATVGFSQVVQLFAPPTNPAYAPRAEIPFINSEKNTSCIQSRQPGLDLGAFESRQPGPET